MMRISERRDGANGKPCGRCQLGAAIAGNARRFPQEGELHPSSAGHVTRPNSDDRRVERQLSLRSLKKEGRKLGAGAHENEMTDLQMGVQPKGTKTEQKGTQQDVMRKGG